MSVAHLQCISCHATFPTSAPLYRCGHCGDLLDVTYEYPTIAPDVLRHTWLQRRLSQQPSDISGVWRYREMLPFVEDETRIVTYPEGNTPLLDAPRSARYAGLHRLQVKHQGGNPTGSFKDNGMCTGITQASILGMSAVLCASTGNTSASMAAYAARAGMVGIVLIPDGQIAYGKLSQSLDYGALTLQVAGDFDVALRLVEEVAVKANIYVLNSVNPFRLEGQKTIMIEMLEQRGWKVPDRVVVPGGNLGNSSAFGKGLRELYDCGLIDRLPRITIVQAAGAAPLYRMMVEGHSDLTPLHAHTLATAIKIGAPMSWKKAQRAMDWTDGWVTAVSEQDIADAKAIIGRDGIGCEPASAATLAGLRALVAQGTDSPIDPDEDVVAILTGNVLKDPDYTIHYHLGDLYEDYETTTQVVRHNAPLVSHYANRPVRVAASAEAIMAQIERFRAS